MKALEVMPEKKSLSQFMLPVKSEAYKKLWYSVVATTQDSVKRKPIMSVHRVKG